MSSTLAVVKEVAVAQTKDVHKRYLADTRTGRSPRATNVSGFYQGAYAYTTDAGTDRAERLPAPNITNPDAPGFLRPLPHAPNGSNHLDNARGSGY
jgi:hypothetical protein